MHYRIVILAAFSFGLGLTGMARADIAAPLPPAKTAVTIKIEVDENAKGPKLVIPSQVITTPRIRPVPRKDPNSQLLNDNGDRIAEYSVELDEANAEPESPSQPKSGLLFAGLALALSLAFGGVWLFRKNGKNSPRAMGLLIATGIALSIGAAVWANVPAPPVRERPKAPPALPSAFEGKANVEFFYGAEPIRLILDKESYEKLKKGELKLPENNAPPKPNAPPR
jgi:hypothetical protein